MPHRKVEYWINEYVIVRFPQHMRPYNRPIEKRQYLRYEDNINMQELLQDSKRIELSDKIR